MHRNAVIKAVHHFLLGLPPETSHWIVARLLERFQRSVKLKSRETPIRVSGLQFNNRLGLAAGFDKDGRWPRAFEGLGYGFVEVGTVTPLPQAGNPKPRLWRFRDREALINRMGFNNCGIQQFKMNLARYRATIPIFANIGKGRDTPSGSALSDYRTCLEGLSGLVDGFVINVSSPNTPGLRDLQSIDFLDRLEPILPSVPVWIKLAPDLSTEDLKLLCHRINDSRMLSGVVLTNTSIVLARELYGFEQGGLSGRPLFNRALEMVTAARVVLKNEKSIIGVGGISSGDDALAMRSAGADLIEIFTTFIFKGPAIVSQIISSLS